MSTKHTEWIVRLAVGMALIFGGLRLSNAQMILIDDFNDGNDDGWTHRDDTIGDPWGPGTFDASSFEYHLFGASEVPLGEAGLLGATWDASVDPVYSDGFLRAKIRANNDTSLVMLMMRNSVFGTGYVFGANPAAATAERFYFSKFVAGQGEVVNERFFADEPFRAGEDWFIEAGAVDDQLSMKVWKLGEPEPLIPQWTFTDSSSLPPGRIGVITWHWPLELTPPGIVDVAFDDIYFTPIPEPSACVLLVVSTIGVAWPVRRHKQRVA